MNHPSIRQLAACLVAGLLLAGCTSQATRSEAPADGKDTKVVERRAIERWDLLIQKKAEKAYDFLSPGFRATKKREDYAQEMNNRPVRWTKVLPYKQACDKPDICILDLQIDYSTKMPGVGTDVSSVGFVRETWIRSKGQWYMLPDAKPATGGQ
ncbi:MAG TPA: hypothetical protein PKC03_00240 [Dokdonella sp.]|nr:hypothetical protein [Dokdonella sp.]